MNEQARTRGHCCATAVFDCSPAYFLVKGTRYREERYSTQQQAANLIRRVPPGFKAYAATADHNDEDNQMLDSLYKRLDRATVYTRGSIVPQGDNAAGGRRQSCRTRDHYLIGTKLEYGGEFW
jgi:hypothetical protein